jgi:hypothetical protein
MSAHQTSPPSCAGRCRSNPRRGPSALASSTSRTPRPAEAQWQTIPSASEECWHIYYGDVRAGAIAKKNGAPSVGFAASIPAADPSEFLTGSAPDFEKARADFKAAWRIFSAKSDQRQITKLGATIRDWRAWKFAMWDMGMTHTWDGTARCFCGASITISSVARHVRTTHKMRPRAEALN